MGRQDSTNARTDVRTRLEIMKTAIAEADPVRAAMDREKYIIKGLSTQNFYKETTKSTGYTKASRQNLRDLKKALLAYSIAIGV
jgi:hypothetical protein